MGEDNKILRSLGKNVAIARKQCGLTQEELAYRIGKSDKYVSMIERGESGMSLTALVRLCNSLGISPNRLFEGIITKNVADADSQIIDNLSVLTAKDKEFLLGVIDYIIQKGSN